MIIKVNLPTDFTKDESWDKLQAIAYEGDNLVPDFCKGLKRGIELMIEELRKQGIKVRS